MFPFSKKPGIGLDLSDSALKIVQLQETSSGLSLRSYNKTKIPRGLMQGGAIKKEKEVVDILRSALKNPVGSPFIGKRVFCNLPEEKVFIRVIQLPLMKKDELAKAVKWEAEGNIPLSIDEVYLSWQIIPPVERNIDHYDILIAAAPRDLTESYAGLIEKAGLETVALEPESAAITRALIRDDELKPIIIIDIGAGGSNFVIYAGLAVRFTSRVQISGELFTQAIIKTMNVDEHTANRFKIEVGLDGSQQKGKVCKALMLLVADLIKQTEEYIDFYYDQAKHVHAPGSDNVSQILLCGGDSLLFNLPEVLSKELKIPVSLANPLIKFNWSDKKIKSDKFLKSFAVDSLEYATALGLALRSFKL